MQAYTGDSRVPSFYSSRVSINFSNTLAGATGDEQRKFLAKNFRVFEKLVTNEL